MDDTLQSQATAERVFDNRQSTKAYILSAAKTGHVTQCMAVADLLGLEIEEVLQERGINKALPVWRREIAKIGWLFAALRTAWRFRKGKLILLASNRSVLSSCRLLKILRGNQVLILYIGSPKKWKTHCADIILRLEHEREPGRDEERRYPWHPKQVWLDAPICMPLPVAETDAGKVAVLLGGLNISYADEAKDYADLLDQLEVLAQSVPVTIVFSRRTKQSVEDAVHQRFSQTKAELVAAEDRDGFLRACKEAGAFVVTPDSITMIAEACATGKPVYVARLPVKRTGTRNHRFVETNLQNGHIKEFDGEISFERRDFDRSDIEAARRDLSRFIQAWMNDPSFISD
jgi:mitochondrial fission protein ELM1